MSYRLIHPWKTATALTILQEPCSSMNLPKRSLNTYTANQTAFKYTECWVLQSSWLLDDKLNNCYLWRNPSDIVDLGRHCGVRINTGWWYLHYAVREAIGWWYLIYVVREDTGWWPVITLLRGTQPGDTRVYAVAGGTAFWYLVLRC